MYSNQPGYHDAFEQAYIAYHSKLLDYSIKKIHDREQAASIVMDAFVKVFERRHVNGMEAVYPLLHTTVKHRCIDHLRRQKSVKKRLTEFARFQNLSTDPMSLSDIEDLESEQLKNQHIMLEELERLPKKSQEVIRKLYLENVSAKNFARQKGISISTVGNLKLYALRLLRKKLK